MCTRRAFLGAAGLAGNLLAAESGRPTLWDYFDREITAADVDRQRILSAIGNRGELQKLQENVRAFLQQAIGAFPERTPLNARVTGTLTRPDYLIEKIVYESRPGFYVSANLYRPRTGATLPGVVQLCGHYDEGKAAPDYQSACIGLARKGFAALIFDPIGQGERRMYGASSTGEHSIAGRPCFLLGRTLAQFRVWDAMRALDLLESRPEVDPTRLGLLGHSGGGMMTLLTAPLESRVKAVMSCCAVTSFYHKFKALLIADPEQIVPGIYARHIDHPELIAAVAPRAFLIGEALRDYVPRDGTRRTYRETKRLFEIAGVPGNINLVETDDEHKLNRELREACYGWMQLHLQGERGNTREPEIRVESKEDLFCSPGGSVLKISGTRTIFDINRLEEQRLRLARARPNLVSIRTLLALPKTVRPAKRISDVEVETETGIRIATRQATSVNGGDLLIVVGESGSPIAAALKESPHAVVEMTAREGIVPGKHAKYPADDFFALRSFELGRPLLGMRVFDVLQTVRLLRSGYHNVYLLGSGSAGIVALHAAALDSSIAGVATWNALRSWQEVFEHPVDSEPVSSFVPGALQRYDLPDLEVLIAPRPCIHRNGAAIDATTIAGILKELGLR